VLDDVEASAVEKCGECGDEGGERGMRGGELREMFEKVGLRC
jgi:hypothetical protein